MLGTNVKGDTQGSAITDVAGVFKKVLISQNKLIRRVLASGALDIPKNEDSKPIRLMDRMFNIRVVGHDSTILWDIISTLVQCVYCGSMLYKDRKHFENIPYVRTMSVSDCCGLVHYCQEKCQRAHAKEHKGMCVGRFELPIDMTTRSEYAQEMINALYGMSSHVRREQKMAYVCASALGYMKTLGCERFREWWEYHTHEDDLDEPDAIDNTQCTRRAIVFVATLNDRHDCLSFMPVTLGEMRLIFEQKQILEVLELWKRIDLMSDKKERAIIALALREVEYNKMVPPVAMVDSRAYRNSIRYNIKTILLPQHCVVKMSL